MVRGYVGVVDAGDRLIVTDCEVVLRLGCFDISRVNVVCDDLITGFMHQLGCVHTIILVITETSFHILGMHHSLFAFLVIRVIGGVKYFPDVFIRSCKIFFIESIWFFFSSGFLSILIITEFVRKFMDRDLDWSIVRHSHFWEIRIHRDIGGGFPGVSRLSGGVGVTGVRSDGVCELGGSGLR